MDQDTKNEFGKIKNEFGKMKNEFGKVKNEFGKIKKSISGLKRSVGKTERAIRNLTKNSLEIFATRNQLEDFKVWAQETFVTKEYFDKFTPLFEEIMEEIKQNRYERMVYHSRYEYLEDKVIDHGKRITVLEHKK